jgi:hypothetical protein
MSKTWTQKDAFGRQGVWTKAKCHACGAPVNVLVGAAGHPVCDACFGAWIVRAFGEDLPTTAERRKKPR